MNDYHSTGNVKNFSMGWKRMRIAMQHLHEFAYEVGDDSSNVFSEQALRLTTCGFCLERLPRNMAETPMMSMQVLIGPCGHTFHAKTQHEGYGYTCYQKVTHLNKDVMSHAHCAHCRRDGISKQAFGAGYDSESHKKKFKSDLPLHLYPNSEKKAKTTSDNDSALSFQTKGDYDNERDISLMKHAFSNDYCNPVFHCASRMTGRGPMGRGPMGRGPMGRGPMGRGPMGRGPMGRGPMGRGLMGRGPMGRGFLNTGNNVAHFTGYEERYVPNSNVHYLKKSFKSALEGSESGDEDRRPLKNQKMENEVNDVEKILNEPV